MSAQHRLIWDFRGPEAKHFAEHHAKHLKEYVQSKELEEVICDIEELTPMRWIAYMQGKKNQMESIKPILKPQFEMPIEE